MKLDESLLKKIILEVIAEEDGEETTDSEEKPQKPSAPEQGSEETPPIKLKIDIPDEPYSGARDRAVDEEPTDDEMSDIEKEFEGVVEEGPAYEYAKHMKNIEKSWTVTKKSVMNLAKELKKKGFKDEAFTIEKKFQASYNNFDHYFEDIMNKLQ